MWIYTVNLLSFPIWGILYNSSFQWKKIIKICMFMQLYLLCILRSTNIGSDTETYLKYFQILSSEIGFMQQWDFVGLERGYVGINKVIGIMTNDPRIFLAIISFFILSSFFFFCDKYCGNLWLGCYLFVAMGFYAQSWYVLRQYSAIAILLYSIKYAIEQKPLKFFLLILVAFCFHRTALVFSLVYICGRFRLNMLSFFGMLASVTFLSMFSTQIVGLLNIFARIEGTIGYTGGVNYLIFLWLSFLILTYFMPANKYAKQDNVFNIFYNMLAVACLFQILALKYELLVRLVYYFSLSLIVLIPYFIKNRFNKIEDRYIATLSICVLMFLWFTIKLYSDGVIYLGEYSLFW